ncbi:MAG: toxic anion resistance protein [Spirochaetales bacterium]|nr:toxic anion resistance protein [Spirochaetales bacterium]
MSDSKEETKIIVPSVGSIKEELGLEKVILDEGNKNELEKEADRFADEVVNMNMDEEYDSGQFKDIMDSYGLSIQEECSHHSKMLQEPIRQFSMNCSEDSAIGKSLVDLTIKVEDLNPNKIEIFDDSAVGKFFNKAGRQIKKYFAKYQSSQKMIDRIIGALNDGKEQLLRDNAILKEDQSVMRKRTKKLEKAILLGEAIDKKLDYKLQREIEKDSKMHSYVADELLFPLRQRIIDLQQQLAVNQQGMIALELIIRNNSELVKGVNRALNVTVTALEVAVTVAQALYHQKLVLDQIDALNQTTSSLISGTASRLRTQGVAIQKQAAGTMLNMDDLKSAFTDLDEAIGEISHFRQEALPQMANTIKELDDMTGKSEEVIRRMEKGNRASAMAGKQGINYEILDEA